MSWYAKKDSQSAADPNILRPRGAPLSLSQLTIVRTGELKALSDKQFVTYVQLLGGRSTTAVSGKTTYLVKGENPGKQKEAAALKNNVKIITEDQFFELVRKNSFKITGRKCQEVTYDESLVLDPGVQPELSAHDNGVATEEKLAFFPTDLFILKYQPQAVDQLVGNRSLFEEITNALLDSKINQLFITGASGVGKSLYFRVFQQQYKQYRVVFINSDQQRTPKLINSIVSSYQSAARRAIFVFDDADSIEAFGVPQIIKEAERYPDSKFVLIAQDGQNKKFTSFKKNALVCLVKRPQKQQVAKYIESILESEFPQMRDAGQIAQIAAEKAEGDIRNALNWLYYAAAGGQLTPTAVSQSFDYFSVDKSFAEWSSFFFNARREIHQDKQYLAHLREGYYQEQLLYPSIVQNYLAQTDYNSQFAIESSDILSNIDNIQREMFKIGDWAKSKCAAGYLQSLALLLTGLNCQSSKFNYPQFPSVISIDSTVRNQTNEWNCFTNECAIFDNETFVLILENCLQDEYIFDVFNCEQFENVQDIISWNIDGKDLKRVKTLINNQTIRQQLKSKKQYK